MGIALSEDSSTALATYSIFSFQKELANVLAGPISSALILRSTNVASYGVMRYKNIVIFTGAGMLLSSLSVGVWYFRPAKLFRRYI